MGSEANFDLVRFDDLAKQNGVAVQYYDRGQTLDVVYRLPKGHMTRLKSIQVTADYFNKSDFTSKKSKCNLFLRYQPVQNKKISETTVRLKCDSQKEAFGFLYILLFMPEKIGYVLEKNGECKDVTSDELFMTGRPFKKRPAILYLFLLLVVAALVVTEIILAPALIVLGAVIGVAAFIFWPIYSLFLAPIKADENHKWKYTLKEDPYVDGYLITGTFRDREVRKEEKRNSSQYLEKQIHRRMLQNLFRK